MAQPLHQAVAVRVALAIDDPQLAHDTAALLEARGLVAGSSPVEDACSQTVNAIAYAPSAPLTPKHAAQIAPACRTAAEAQRPVVMLNAGTASTRKETSPRVAAIAYLINAGVVVCDDPDTWIETLVLLSQYGAPPGPNTAIVAATGSWLARSAAALARQAHPFGVRLPPVWNIGEQTAKSDIVLVDHRSFVEQEPSGRLPDTLAVPLVGRGEVVRELVDLGVIPLVGLRAAVAAARIAGQFGQAVAEGLGPGDSRHNRQRINPDDERVVRQLDSLGSRAGDHETKILLAAYGIPVTRQAVATTPSAATRIAKRAGYPVELKPWGPDVPSEADGCLLHRDLHTAAQVRRAYGIIAQELGGDQEAAVIVREAPPTGRQLRVHLQQFAGLGWVLLLDVSGVPDPIAGCAPLRPSQADRLAGWVHRARAGDPPPSRNAVADLLLRVSQLAVDHGDAIAELILHRVVVCDDDAKVVVVDAHAVLK